ncbi:MAG: hypothetical protein RIC55_00600 [Pirellulaceae bacterium]
MNRRIVSQRRGTLLLVLIAIGLCPLLCDWAVAQQDTQQAFQKWAVEYAIAQQRSSKFQLDEQEDMNFNDLYDKIWKPWDAALLKFRHWLDDNVKDSDERDRRWRAGLEQRDQKLLALFRDNFRRGRHSEAWIYHSLLWYELPSQGVATREAFDVYNKSYEAVKAEMEAFAKLAVSGQYDCTPRGAGTGGRLHLVVVEGVGPASPQHVAELKAGPQDPGAWPHFPSLQVVFNLSDDSEAPWNNCITADIRHYDRTTGDVMRAGLEWMAGRWGVYEVLLAEKGMQAAQDAFRRNLSVESGADSIEFRDAATRIGLSLQRVRPYGTIEMRKHWSFMNRCTPAPVDGARGLDAREAATKTLRIPAP